MKYQIGDKVRIRPDLFETDTNLIKYKIPNKIYQITSIPSEFNFGYGLDCNSPLKYYEKELVPANTNNKIKQLKERLQ